MAVVIAAVLPELLTQLYAKAISQQLPMQHNSWDALVTDPASQPTAVVLNLTFSSGRLDGNHSSYSFNVSEGTPLLGRLEEGTTSAQRSEFVAHLLGLVVIRNGTARFSVGEGLAGVDVRYGAPEITHASHSSSAHIVVPIDTMNIAPTVQVGVAPPFRECALKNGCVALPFTLTVEAGKSGHVNAPYTYKPIDESPTTAEFLSPNNDQMHPLAVEVIDDAPRLVTGRVLLDSGFVVLPPAVASFAIGLLAGLPLIILLFVVPAGTDDFGPFQPVVRNVVWLVLAFHIAIWGGAVLVDAAAGIRANLTKSYEQRVFYLVPSMAGVFGLLLVFGVVLWPAALRYRARSQLRENPATARTRPLAIAAAGGLILAYAACRLRGSQDHKVLVVLGIMIAMSIVVRVIAGPVGQLVRATVVLLGASVLVGASYFVPVLVQGPRGGLRYLMVAIFIAFAVATTSGFAWLFGWLTLEALTSQPFSDSPGDWTILDNPSRPPISTNQRLLGWLPTFVLAIIVAPSVWGVIRGRTSTLSPWSLLELGFGLDRLVYYPAAACLFILFRRMEDEEAKFRAGRIRVLGIAFLLLLTFSSTAKWFYLPLPFLFSWLLLGTVILPKKRVRSVARDTPDPVRLQTLLDARIVSNRLRSVRQKYESADPDIADYDWQKTQLKKELDDLETRAAREGDPYLVPPADTRWEGGKRGFTYGFIFSIPSMTLLLYQRFTSNDTAVPYPLLGFTGIVPTVLQWAIYGFFLGYFYTLIRGRTGIEKGAWLFLVLLVHNTFVALLSFPDGNWASLLFWSLQTFAQLVIVALVIGDYGIARRAKLGWRDLIEIHDARWVAAWGVSAAAAIGSVALSLFTTAATDYAKSLNPPPSATGGQITPPTTKPGGG